jgi:hypothetical protein
MGSSRGVMGIDDKGVDDVEGREDDEAVDDMLRRWD